METGTQKTDYTPENIELLIETNRKLSEETLQLKAKASELETNLENAEKRIEWLMEQFKLNKQRTFGNKAESSKSLQLSLVFDETEESVEASEESVTIESIAYTRKKKTAGRKIDTSKLPREIVSHDLSEDQKQCDRCGKELKKFGEDRSEQLEYIPAKLKVIEHVCSKYTCRCCETIKTASKPEMPIAKSMATPSLITEVIIKKYSHHLPWYRQSKIFAQEGIDIPANTICNWYLQAGEVLEPLREALKSQLSRVNVLQADETPVKVLKDNIRGYMWCYHGCNPQNRFILFEYNDSRSGKVVSDNLKDYQGILQTDGYSGYNSLRAREDIISLGCWAHCRRKFADVVKISSKAGKAHEVMKWITKLYQIESASREQKLSFAERRKLRQEQAPIVLQKIYDLITKSSPPTKSALGKAITYALNQWKHLIKYIDYGEAEIDNNWVENQIRPFALGRKNWLFLGNERSANIAAFFYSLIQTCILNGIDSRKYLNYVLNQTGKMRRNEIDLTSLLGAVNDFV
ncbi:MAG: IS66 family transposase [Methylomarinum sp.]|nr:IS66 family transposase [Methylomarinum sp.]